MAEFQGKVAIVTGGARGIGRAISLAFAREGANVACADIDDEAGREIEELAQSYPGTVIYRKADVSQSAACRELIAWTVSEWGGLDVLCNNVGIQPMSSYLPAHELPEEAWDRIIAVNLTSGFLMSKYSIPELQKRGGGAIINIASVQGLQSAKGVSAYAASKGGMINLTRQLALDYAADNIRVLAVNPGTIETPLALAAMNNDLQALRDASARVHPLGRSGKPEEVAEVVLFLASDRASFMTGDNVCVDGGLMAKGAWQE